MMMFIFHVQLCYSVFGSVPNFALRNSIYTNILFHIMLSTIDLPYTPHPVSNWAPQTTTNWKKLVASKHLTSDWTVENVSQSPFGTFKGGAIGFYVLETPPEWSSLNFILSFVLIFLRKFLM